MNVRWILAALAWVCIVALPTAMMVYVPKWFDSAWADAALVPLALVAIWVLVRNHRRRREQLKSR